MRSIYPVVLLASLPEVVPLLEPRVPKSSASARPWTRSQRSHVPQAERAEMAKGMVLRTGLVLGEWSVCLIIMNEGVVDNILRGD